MNMHIMTLPLLLLPVIPAFAADTSIVVYQATQVQVYSDAQGMELMDALRSGDTARATELFDSMVGRREVSLDLSVVQTTICGSLLETALAPPDSSPQREGPALISTRPPGGAASAPKQQVAVAAATPYTPAGTDYVSGASSLTATGAVPYVTAPGTLGQDAALNYNPTGSVLQLGTGIHQVEIRPKNTEPYGVLSVRSSTPNTATAWDIFPNTDPNQGAWIDVCNDDLIANPSVSWRCLVLYATPDAYFIGVHHENWTITPSKPLYIGGEWIEFRANGPFWGHSTGRLEDGALTLFDATTDLPYFGVKKGLGLMRLMNGMQLAWSSTNSIYTPTDTGLTRSAAGVVQATNGSTGYGSVDALGYNAGGVPGVTMTCHGSPTSLTVTSGIITAITCP
jgi:hypothetical protein